MGFTRPFLMPETVAVPPTEPWRVRVAVPPSMAGHAKRTRSRPVPPVGTEPIDKRAAASDALRAAIRWEKPAKEAQVAGTGVVGSRTWRQLVLIAGPRARVSIARRVPRVMGDTATVT